MTIVEVSQVLISGISGRYSSWMVDDLPAMTLGFIANDKFWVSTIHQSTDPPATLTDQRRAAFQSRISFNLIIFNNQRIAHASHQTKELAKSMLATTRTTRINPLMEPAWRVCSTSRWPGMMQGKGGKDGFEFHAGRQRGAPDRGRWPCTPERDGSTQQQSYLKS